MTKLKWSDPHSIRDIVFDVGLRPPDAPGVYVLTRDVTGVPDGPLSVLYVGKSEHLLGRFGDLAFGLLRFGVFRHTAAVRLLVYCADRELDPLDLGYAWAVADCARCAEIELHSQLWPTSLNRQRGRNCSKHPKAGKFYRKSRAVK